MKPLLSLFTTIIIGLLATMAMADVFVPDGLNPGDEYHLVFVTDGAISALSSDVGAYNSFVNSQAAMNPSLNGTNMGISYAAIASTELVDARDNASVEAPVYLFDSTLVATGFADIWDGSINSGIQIDQFGDTQRIDVVYTGTDSSGFGISGFELGSASDLTFLGFNNITDSGWIATGSGTIRFPQRIYALSEKLTVAIPEPASFVAYAGVGLLIGVCRRRSAIHRQSESSQ